MNLPAPPTVQHSAPPADECTEQGAIAAAHTSATEMAALVRRLEAERDEALAERDCLRIELNVRNCALDATKTHFMILDMRQGGAIIYINRAMATAHGYEMLELIGSKASRLLAVDECAKELHEMSAAMRAGLAANTVLRGLHRNGSRFSVGTFVGPVRDADGVVTHYVSVGADITARLEEEANRRRLQEQLVNEMRERERMASELRLAHKLEAVGQLAAGIAHEINTPVQYVGDSTYFLESASRDLDALLETYRSEINSLPANEPLLAARERLREAEARADLDFLRDEVPKAIARALDGIGRVTHIVRAIKEFAHPDSHEQSAADINRAIQTTLTVARNEYKYFATVETQAAELPEVICNIGELNQVFVNLIVNAAHAIQASGQDANSGRITIVTEHHGDEVLIRVSDNGCGIPEQNIERIFDPFFTTKEVGKGTGQGLSIARSIIVERHAGRLEVNSKVGVGTEFIIHLPVAGRGAEKAQ